ncbi:MAG: M20 family metallopeptidase [Sedimentibacter sp.]
MNIDELKKEIFIIENNLSKEFESISEFIFNNPEISEKEFISSKYLVDLMKRYKFKITYPYCALPTAFRAEYGDDGPTIAVLAEYDALPGYGEKGNEIAHACGHNWIAASSAGAAIVLSILKEKCNFNGKIIVIGTPAEETIGSKIDMVKANAFNDIDICLESHIGSTNDICFIAHARNSLEFIFKGKATHAASTPYDGINALDGVMLTFAGINALRQHLKSDVRIHGIITEGGTACNIIPDKAACKIGIRSINKKDLDIITEKVINIAKGASLMTGAEMSYMYYENSYDTLLHNPILTELTKNNLENVGITNIDDNGLSEPKGSTDLGNVSQICPTQYIIISLDTPENVNVHEEDIIKYVNSSLAYDKMHKVIKAMSCIALELFLNPNKVNEIKMWHKSNEKDIC